MRREGVVGQRLPVGEHGDAQLGREERDLVGEALRVGRLGGDDRQQRAAGALLLGEAGEQQGVGRAGRAGQREALAGGDVGEMHEGGRKSRAAREQSSDFRWRDAPAPTRGLSFVPAAIDPSPMPTPSPNVRRLYALVPCAGSGVRAGAPIAKQYVEVAGRPLVAHTLAALVGGAAAEPDPGRRSRPTTSTSRRLVGLPVDPRLALARCGGATRGATVADGLAKLAGRGATADDWVLVHDAARCLVRAEWIDALIDACRDDARRRPARAAGGRHAEARRRRPRRRDARPRDDVWQAQTPQMFRIGVLPTRWRAAGRTRPTRPARSRRIGLSAAAGARLARELQGHLPGRLRAGRGAARAARRPHEAARPDLARRRGLGHARAGRRPQARARRRRDRRTRTACSAIRMPTRCCHAITDALFGAAALGDIGRHFPTPTRSTRAPIRWRCWPRRRAACARGLADRQRRRTVIAQAPQARAAHRGDAPAHRRRARRRRSIRSA